MTSKEQLGLYMVAYKEAADNDFMSRLTGKPLAAPVGWDPNMVFPSGSSPVQYSPVDYARQALAQVYGQNHLNSLADDAYVMRKWRAAMQGRNAAQLQAAYRKAYLGHNGMLASQGASYGGDKAKNYGIYGNGGMPVQRPQMMAGPRFQNNGAGAATAGQYNAIQYWRNFQKQRSAAFRNQADQQARKMNGLPPARQQAAQPPKPQSTTTSAIPDDLRKEVIGSLGNNSMTA